MKLSLLAAVARNGVIGSEGDLPWKLKDDLRHFSKTTKGKTVILGRKTHESILKVTGGTPLPERRSVVITRQEGYEAPGCEVVHSWKDALKAVESDEEAVVIGGGEIYALALPYADELVISRVHADIEGDVKFPEWKDEEWKLARSEEFAKNERNEYPFTIEWYDRVDAFVWMGNARTVEQREIMRQIRADGVCPFCRETLENYHTQPILKEGEHWVLSPSQYPRDNSKVYLMAFAKKHAVHLTDLDPEAGAELFELCQWAVRHYKVEDQGGAIAMRFGSPEDTGGTIHHIHAHFIIPNPESDEPVRFKIGRNKK